MVLVSVCVSSSCVLDLWSLRSKLFAILIKLLRSVLVVIVIIFMYCICYINGDASYKVAC